MRVQPENDLRGTASQTFAAVLTALIVVGLLAGCIWMIAEAYRP